MARSSNRDSISLHDLSVLYDLELTSGQTHHEAQALIMKKGKSRRPQTCGNNGDGCQHRSEPPATVQDFQATFQELHNAPLGLESQTRKASRIPGIVTDETDSSLSHAVECTMIRNSTKVQRSRAYGGEDLRIPGMRQDRLDVGEAHP